MEAEVVWDEGEKFSLNSEARLLKESLASIRGFIDGKINGNLTK